MTPQERRAIFSRLRSTPLPGRVCDLVPYAPEHAQAVVDMRNTERTRYFLNQKELATVEGQHAWYKSYLERDNDVYWVLVARDGRVVGTNALYDFEWDGSNCQIGRHVTDEKVALEAPYTLDGQFAIIKYALNELKMKRIESVIKPDNAKVISMNARLGFRFEGTRDLRGVEYNVYILDNEHFNPGPMEAILEHWSKRNKA